ncbi:MULTISPECIES: hypothetical protein [Sphingomonas]|jgi:hypothetical protein|uniref:hypothetical protein n=1 Tax=Sphingomonas TaxID=13687 RepID=UPI001AE2F809
MFDPLSDIAKNALLAVSGSLVGLMALWVSLETILFLKRNRKSIWKVAERISFPFLSSFVNLLTVSYVIAAAHALQVDVNVLLSGLTTILSSNLFWFSAGGMFGLALSSAGKNWLQARRHQRESADGRSAPVQMN